ncbi:hypothetical protein [Clostridium botulinum]
MEEDLILIGDLKEIAPTKCSIGYIHFYPFHFAYGFGKTKEEIETMGIGIFVPRPVKPKFKEGYYLTEYYNPIENVIFYEYEDIPDYEENTPGSKEEIQDERIEKLKKENQELENQLLLAENKNLGGIL